MHQGVAHFNPLFQNVHELHSWGFFRYLRGLATSKPTTESSNARSSVVNLALFGLGRAGSIHLNNILATRRVELKYVVEYDEDRWNIVKDRLNLDHVKYVNPAEAEVVYNDPDLDAVIVATPTCTHEEFITKSLEGGKAVFTEKPVSEEADAVERCYDLASKVGRPLFCAFNRRFDPSFDNVKNNVRSGKLGQVNQIKLTSRDSPLPSLDYLKISGGIFHDCMVHDIDLMTYILGEYPVQVFTQANAMIPEIAGINDHDNVVSTFKFASGKSFFMAFLCFI